MASFTSVTMIRPYCDVLIRMKQKGSWQIYTKALSGLIPVDTAWQRKSYGQDIIGSQWKLTVISILGHVTSARSMLIRCIFLQFL